MGAFEACSHAGLGIVNAIGSGGLGAAAALDLRLCVRVDPDCQGLRGRLRIGDGYVEVEEQVLRAAVEVAASRLGSRPQGLCVDGWTEIPVAAGLKGSSALVNAVVSALARWAGVALDTYALARLGVEAARMAGITVTGALDDHLAVSGCGAYATINPDKLVRWEPELSGWVVLAVPGRRDIRGINVDAYKPFRSLFRAAWRLAVNGMWWEAASLNGLAMKLVHGDPVDTVLRTLEEPEPVAVGVSGKGPTVYAVYQDEAEARKAAETLSTRLQGWRTLVARVIPCSSATRKPCTA